MKHIYQSLFRDSSNGYARYKVTRNETGEADDLLILEVNNAYQNMMGSDKDENLVGSRVSELDHLIPDKWPVESIKFYDKAVKDKDNKTQTIEFTVESTEKVYQIIVVPVTEDEIICRYHDITLVKDDFLKLSRLEQDLNDQMAISSMFFTHSIASLFYMMIDEPVQWNDQVDKEAVLDYVFDHHRITRVNPAMEVQYQTSAENLIGSTTQDMFEKDIETSKNIWTELFSHGRAQIYSEKQRLDGSSMAIKGDYITLYDDEGMITGLYGIQVDITAQKEAEDALIKNSEIYRFSQELGEVGGFEYYPKTGKIRWTEEMYRIHDINPAAKDDTINLMDITLNCLGPFYRDKLEQELEALSSITRKRFDLEAPFTSATGTPRWVRITARPADQYAERLVGSMMEITRQKEIEMKLQKALEVAQLDIQSRTMFLASMSHEIRNPLNGIMGMAQLMETTQLSEEQQELIDLSKTSSVALLRIIDDILDYSKIEAGALTLEEVPFNLFKTLQEIHSIFDKMAASKEVEIILDIDDDVPERVEGDPHRFSQIMNNLLGNALKYTKKGEIRIRATVDQEQQSPEGIVTLKVSVQDTGVGIPQSSMDLLFQVFTQADPSNTRLYGGTGLGLPIAKNIVEHMDGTIWAKSTLGEGSTFTFTVQLKLLMVDTVSAISSASILF